MPATGGLDTLAREPSMRRPHVYERSVPRPRRDAYQVPDNDPGEAARTVVRALAGLIAAADAAGLLALVGLLDAARVEAERLGHGGAGSTS